MYFNITIPEIVGLVGVVMSLASYFLLQIGRIKSHDLNYSLVNFISALFILFSLLEKWNTPAAIIEIAWAIISLLGLYKIFIYRRKFNPPITKSHDYEM